MKILIRILMAALVILIPFMVITGAFNIVLRMPDAYAFEFKNVNFSKQMGLDKGNDEIAESISSFMFGKAEDFSIKMKKGAAQGIILNAEEKAVMQHFRGVLNTTLLSGGVSLILCGSIYFTMFRIKRKDVLGSSLRLMGFVYGVMVVIGCGAYFIPGTRNLFFRLLFLRSFKEDGMLINIFNDGLAHLCLIATVVISALLLGLIAWLTYKLTTERRIFKR